MSPAPLVSVAIPAYRAEATLLRAVNSILDGGLPSSRIEIIIAPDDGRDYLPDLPTIDCLRQCPPGPVKSGVGPARNRAVAAASGQYITYLDADDTLAPGYLASLVPLAQAETMAFATTSIRLGAEELLRRPPAGQRLDFEELGRSGASFRPLVRADLCGDFRNAVAQDIFHAAELLAINGGSAPVSAVPYCLELGPESVSAQTGYADRIEVAYRRYRDDIRTGQSRVPAPLTDQAAQVFDTRLKLNHAFRKAGKGRRFYQFVADKPGTP